MAVPSNVTVAWPSTRASLPGSGWSEVTELRGYYVKGAGTDADADLSTAYGNSGHSHTGASHTPVVQAHSHTYSGGAASATVNAKTGGSTTGVATSNHYHPGASSGTTVQVLTSSSISSVAASNINALPWVRVIWIKSDGTPTGLPNGCWAFFESDSADFPASWTRAASGRFLFGASALEDGGSTGGAETHIHTGSCTSHLESGTHTHTYTSAGPQGIATRTQTGSSTAASNDHTHTLTLDASYEDPTGSIVVIDASNGEPPYEKINVIANGTGGASLPDQIICGYVGTDAAADALTDWARYTGLDDTFVKGCSADSQVGTPGGGTSHSHTASCTVAWGAGHEHTVSAEGAASTTKSLNSSTAKASSSTHTHLWTHESVDRVAETACSTSLNTCTTDAAIPPYKKIIFVQYTEPAATFDPTRFFLVM